jgi:hypothetical protein
MLNSVARRLFFVLAVVLIPGANIYSYQQYPQTPPTFYYYWAQRDPTYPGNVIGRDLDPNISWFVYEHFSKMSLWERRCRTSHPAADTHRGIVLCNPINVTGDDLDWTRDRFRAQINQAYGQYYQKVVERHAHATALALSVLIGCIVVFGIGQWVIRGQLTASSRGGEGAQH